MTEDTMYQIGDQVKRIEARESVKATVLSVTDGINGQILELEYVEGGHGYWPADAVTPIGTTSTVPGPQGPEGPQGHAGAASTVPGPQGPEGPQWHAGAASTVPGSQGSTGAT